MSWKSCFCVTFKCWVYVKMQSTYDFVWMPKKMFYLWTPKHKGISSKYGKYTKLFIIIRINCNKVYIFLVIILEKGKHTR